MAEEGGEGQRDWRERPCLQVFKSLLPLKLVVRSPALPVLPEPGCREQQKLVATSVPLLLLRFHCWIARVLLHRAAGPGERVTETHSDQG